MSVRLDSNEKAIKENLIFFLKQWNDIFNEKHEENIDIYCGLNLN